MRNLIFCAALGAVALSVGSASAQENGRVVTTERPRVVTYEKRPNAPLLVTGGLIFAASYITGVVVAAESPRKEDKSLYAPVVGPWIDIARRDDCNASDTACNTQNTERGLLIAMGIAQGVGAVLAVASFFIPERNLVERVVITPMAYKGGGGVGVGGRF